MYFYYNFKAEIKKNEIEKDPNLLLTLKQFECILIYFIIAIL